MKKIYLGLMVLLFPQISKGGMLLEHYFYDFTCPENTPLSSSYGVKCVDCTHLESIDSNKRGIIVDGKCNLDSDSGKRQCDETIKVMNYLETCSNRTEDEYERSILKECPTEYPVRDLYGSCKSCDFLTEIWVKNAEDCDVCPNRHYEKIDRVCVLNQCPQSHPLFEDGDCLACNTPYLLHVSREECAKCSERVFITGEKEVTERTTEQGEKILMHPASSGCYLSAKNEQEILPKIELAQQGYEIMTVCLDCEKRGERRQDFYTCDEFQDVETLPEFCAKCPQRFYEDGYCKLKPERIIELEKEQKDIPQEGYIFLD